MAKELKRVVGQSNELIRNIIYKDLNINDLKLFKTIVSKINYNNTLFEEFYQIDYAELDMVGIKKTNRYSTITKSLEKLASTYVNITNKDNTPLKTGLIKNRFMFPRNSSIVTVEIDEELMPHLLDLKNQYTKYGLEYIGNFKNIGTLKLYELLRSFVKHGTYETTIENLRVSLEIEDKKYPLYGNFKKRILTPNIEQINENTDIEVFIEEIQGFAKKVTSIKFHILLKEDKVDNADLTKLIDRVLIINEIKHLVKRFLPGEKAGYYNLELLNLETLEIKNLTNDMTKEDIFKIASSKLKDL